MIMFMVKENKQHFCSKMCSNIGSLLAIILVLTLYSIFFSIPFLITIAITFISIIFLVTLRKKKRSQNESLSQDKQLLNVTEIEFFNQQSETAKNFEQQAEEESNYSLPSDNESINFSVMDKTFEVNVHEFNFKPEADLESESSLPSDSESSTGSIMGESFEIYHHMNVCSSENLAFDIVDAHDYSDDEDEDDDDEEEDGLIEIHLPSSHLSEESIFKQQGVMELIAEMNDMNEDENLIEIDISMGSINGQDFGLKQERKLACLGNQCVSD